MADKPTIIVHGFDVTYEMDWNTKRRDRAVEWVNYSPAHSALLSQTRERVDFMNPAKMKIHSDDENGAKKSDFMRYRWEQIERAYKAWKEGHEIPVDGTPLAAWPGLNNAQAGVFRALGIKSVEQIATMNDAMMNRVQLPGVRDIVNQAKTYLESADRNETAARLTALEAQNSELSEQLKAAIALLAERTEPLKRTKSKREAEEAHA